jgi:hypothetical protein
MFVDIDNRAQVLTPVRLGQTPDEDGHRREAFIQNLVHDHPALIPMAEIEPAFSPLIPVCKELPTPAGYLDNLWITPWGGLVFGEAKLVRNPQARREVVAQALDYARGVADWTFDDLEAAVRLALKQPAFRLWSLVESETDLTEEQFTDAIQRRLRTGQLLLLIIGDGIQEGVEALTSHLQLHAGLHVGLALLDLSLWRNVDGGLIVVPRVPMRTVLIERGIVRLDTDHARVDPPLVDAPRRSATATIQPTTSSEAEFFDKLAIKRPELVAPLRTFLAGLNEMGFAPETGRTIRLLFSPTPDLSATAGHIEANGKVWVQGAASAALKLGRPDAGERYIATIADLIAGRVRRYEKMAPEVVDNAGKGSDLGVLLSEASQWTAAIVVLRDELAPPR